MTSSSSSSSADFRPPPGTFLAFLQDRNGEDLGLVLLEGDIEHPRLVGLIESGDPD